MNNKPDSNSSELIDLTAATRRFPVRMSRRAIERLVRSGVLETVQIQGKSYTTMRAIERYLQTTSRNR